MLSRIDFSKLTGILIGLGTFSQGFWYPLNWCWEKHKAKTWHLIVSWCLASWSSFGLKTYFLFQMAYLNCIIFVISSLMVLGTMIFLCNLPSPIFTSSISLSLRRMSTRLKQAALVIVTTRPTYKFHVYQLTRLAMFICPYDLYF